MAHTPRPMLLALFLAAQSQQLPEQLQTVPLKIVQTQAAGHVVYVVMSLQHDAAKPAKVRTLTRKDSLKGPHMQQVARRVSLDTQAVFVLSPRAMARRDVRSALADASLEAR